MTTQHTPGPWHVEPGCYTVRATEQPMKACYGIAPPAMAVATERLEDARLIAAAAELLAALFDCLQYIESGRVDGARKTSHEMAASVRAAIAKTEGRS